MRVECRLRTGLRCLFGLLCLLSFNALAETAYEPGLAPFEMHINGERVQHRVVLRPLLANEKLQLKIVAGDGDGFNVTQGDQNLALEQGALTWFAPQLPGHYPLTVTRLSDAAMIQIQVLVMQPASSVKNGKLNNYQIGKYPPPLKNLNAYRAPRGFIEVTPELVQLQVSPHFRLGQFLCKQASGYPKYLVLRPRLLEKLEFLLHEVNQKGISADSFVIMSGYRTPFYNRAIGNVANSRHIYGGAADIYIDVDPKDNVMDDINRDGRVDVNDAAYLYRLADSYVNRTGHEHLVGGVGQYRKNASHGPFVHVDVRGSRARWGHKSSKIGGGTGK